MATFSSLTRLHVLQALAEYDARGPEEFLEVYGFAPSPEHTLVHEGHRYDVKAVLGVAHRFATGRLATSEEVDSGMPGAVAILRRRGFEVSEPTSRTIPARTSGSTRTSSPRAHRTAAAPTRRATAVREAPVAICPTCSMTLPATGICDDCG